METLAFIYHADAYENPDQFQVAAQFPCDASVPRSFWFTMVGMAAFLAVVGTPKEAIAQSVYQRGSRGPVVAEIQKALDVPADGIYGPVTEAAVRDYQRRNQLSLVDGKVGAETLAALKVTNPNTPASNLIATTSQPQSAIVMTPTGVGLNLRSAPNGVIVGGLSDGTSVMLTGQERTAGAFTWVELTNNRWVAKDYLRFTETILSATFSATQSSTTTASDAEQVATVSTRTGVGLNLRNAPNGVIMSSAPNGSTLRLTGDQQSAGDYLWAETTQGQWVASEFLRVDDSTPTDSLASTSAEGDRTAVVATNSGIGVNLRNAPNGQIIGSLPDGATVSSTGSEQTAGNYRWVETPRGWIAKDFLSFTGASGGNTTTASQRPAEPEQTVTSAAATTPPNVPSPAAASRLNEPATNVSPGTTPSESPAASVRPSPSGNASAEQPSPTATALSPATANPSPSVETPQPAPSPAESAPVQTPNSESFVTGIDPRSFRGPEGTFPVKAETERYSNPSGETVGAIAPSDTVAVTERWALANGTVWAQLDDGTWVDSTALDLENQP
jgi:peptidoglycan hydrolase-like protein with peptidoglycan-binding domain